MAYVYGHYKADTGELFYIGKGTGNRAWKNSGRNPYWNRVVAKHGRTVAILVDGLTDEEAYAKEKELIEQTGLRNLVNLTEGGLGTTSEISRRQWQDPTFKHNVKLGTTKKWEDPEFRKKHAAAQKRKSQSTEYKEKMRNLVLSKIKENVGGWVESSREKQRRTHSSIEFRTKMSKLALERPRETCQLCGKPNLDPGNFAQHHIDGKCLTSKRYLRSKGISDKNS